jgi:hypothetical protein
MASGPTPLSCRRIVPHTLSWPIARLLLLLGGGKRWGKVVIAAPSPPAQPSAALKVPPKTPASQGSSPSSSSGGGGDSAPGDPSHKGSKSSSGQVAGASTSYIEFLVTSELTVECGSGLVVAQRDRWGASPPSLLPSWARLGAGLAALPLAAVWGRVAA